MFERVFTKLYCAENGRPPAKPVHLMLCLRNLKNLGNLSEQSFVEQWLENIYYQHFWGNGEFASHAPCAASERVHFRHLIGKVEVELILTKSIRTNGNDAHGPRVRVDNTAPEKNIAFLSDNKLHRKGWL